MDGPLNISVAEPKFGTHVRVWNFSLMVCQKCLVKKKNLVYDESKVDARSNLSEHPCK